MPRTVASALPAKHRLLALVADRTLRYDFTVWQWGDAIAIDGLVDAANVLNAPQLLHRPIAFYRRWSRRAPTWADHLTPGGALVRLAEDDSDLRLAALRLAETLTEAPRSEKGLSLYRPDLGIVRNSCWVDTLYHEPVFFSRLAAVTADETWLEEAVRVWRTHVDALSVPGGSFLAHSHDVAADLTRGYGWGRGNAWALLGMVDCLEVFPVLHPRRDEFVKDFAALAAAVAAAQDRSGFWRTLLDDREAYLETSTAAMFGAAYTKAMRIGLLSSDYRQVAERAWRATTARLDDHGCLYGVSSWTHAATTRDDDPDLYKALPTEANWWGQGAALRAIAERILAGDSP